MIAIGLVDAWLDIWNKLSSNPKVPMLHRSYYRKSIRRIARMFSLPSMLCYLARHAKDSVDVSLSFDMRSYLVSAWAYRCSLIPWTANHQIPDSHGILLSARLDWAEC
jgi:hypothetical protein